MCKHQEHPFDQSQTGGSYVLMQFKVEFRLLWNNSLPNSRPNFGGCILYSNTTYTLINTVILSYQGVIQHSKEAIQTKIHIVWL